MSSIPTCAVRTIPRSRCAACLGGAKPGRFATRWTWRGHQVCPHRHRSQGPAARHDFTGTSRSSTALNRAPAPVQCARALRLRTLVDDEDPHERGLPEALEIVFPPLHAEPGAIRRRGLRQRRNLQVITIRFYGRARPHGAAQADEQLHLRLRAYHLLRERSRRLRRRPEFDGTDAVHTHMTNFPPHRSRGLEFAIPCFSRARHPALQRRQRPPRGGDGVVRRSRSALP